MDIDRRNSTIEISDVVDHNGVARYGVEHAGAPVSGNATIAPWIDEPVRIVFSNLSNLLSYS